MNAGSLFSGDGQLDFGLHLAGIEHSWLCESDPWRREILAKRWPGVPIFDDVRAVDSSAPRVDLLVGGFPCRGASTAGDRTGLEHPETALWWEMARVIRLLRPRLVLIENVANLLTVPSEQPGRAWGEVLGELASQRYVVAWDCLPAAAFGAPHLRDRVFGIAALADQEGWKRGRAATRRGVAGKGRRPEADGRAPADAGRPGREECDGATESGQAQRTRAGDRGASSPDADGYGLRQQPELERGGEGQAEPGIAGDQWGDYRAAIERWEEVAGPAPEPLLRGVDARAARKVVRSRLSALGDGVQLDAGIFLGGKLMSFWEELGNA